MYMQLVAEITRAGLKVVLLEDAMSKLSIERDYRGKSHFSPLARPQSKVSPFHLQASAEMRIVLAALSLKQVLFHINYSNHATSSVKFKHLYLL
jgi:hypothetical protein